MIACVDEGGRKMSRKRLLIMFSCAILLGVSGIFFGLNWSNKEKAPNHQEEAMEAPKNKKDHISTEVNLDMKKLERAYELITSSYVEKVNETKLIEGAIQGMLNTLNDPYSVYMDAKTASQFNESLDSSFNGIGAEITVREGKLMIIAPFKNSPAEKAGIKPKDQIIKIDGESIVGLDLYEATLKIRGEKGTSVELEIMRDGITEPLTFDVMREEIPYETVHAAVKEIKDKKIGYLEITSFAEKTAADFKKQLMKMEKKGIDGLLIDVRGNPGGLLSSVEEIVGLLVTDRKPYVQIEQRDGEKTKYYSKLKESKSYPIAVLIDEGSASASEILAGALKEVENYALVGEKTFGKGTVQQAVPMGDGSNIKLTMFKWLTPNGNWIHQSGIKPTVEVKQPNYFYTHSLTVEKPLSLDMSHSQVQIAQEMLQGLGFGTGRVDGYYSEQTEKAVRAFQFQSGLPQTGVIDDKTAQALEGNILEAISKEENDLQLQTALHLLVR